MEVAPGGPSDASGARDQLTSCDRLPVRHQPTTIDNVHTGGLDGGPVVEDDAIAAAAAHTGEADCATGRSIDSTAKTRAPGVMTIETVVSITIPTDVKRRSH